MKQIVQKRMSCTFNTHSMSATWLEPRMRHQFIAVPASRKPAGYGVALSRQKLYKKYCTAHDKAAYSNPRAQALSCKGSRTPELLRTELPSAIIHMSPIRAPFQNKPLNLQRVFLFSITKSTSHKYHQGHRRHFTQFYLQECWVP